MRSSIVLALTGLAMLTTATPISPPVPHALPLPRPHYPRQENANDTAPCARVSQAIYPSGSGSPTTNIIPAKLAYDCIVSVPLNVQAAKALVRALPAYIQWQSTLDALKNPPAEYVEKVQPPTDIMGGLKLIEEDLDASKYENEYDFGWSLYTLIVSAHDGHFAYIPDSVGSVFTWGRDVPLVSVSEDGKKLPSVFAFHDVLGSQFKNISYTPSAITEINGQDVFEYLENFSQYGSLQDRDALYNNMFYELAHVSLGSSGSGTGMFTGGGRARFAYPGDTTTFTFANGTSLTIENFARVMTSFRDIYSGEDLRDQVFYFGPTSTPSVMTTKLEVEKPVVQVAADEAAPAAAPRTPPGYPQPVIAGAGNVINAFYIDAPGYEDVAVLQVPNFVASLAYEVSFQKVTQEFIPTALAAGKTKMIIDVQANGGGTILQGYDMFKQFFPNIEPNATNRFRAIEDIDLIGQAFSSWASQFPRVETTNSTILRAQSSYFDYHTDMKVDGTNFESWDEKFGPVEMNGGMSVRAMKHCITN